MLELIQLQYRIGDIALSVSTRYLGVAVVEKPPY